MGLYQIGEYVAHNDAEVLMFRLGMQDRAASWRTGSSTLKYSHEEYREAGGGHSYLNKAEAVFAFEEEKDVRCAKP
jgi:hypothetical protein